MVGRAQQLGFQFRTRGGARAGAGRPSKGIAAGVPHLRRPAHSYLHPVHVTLRIRRGVPSLREPSLFAQVRRALADGKERFGFSLAHFSVQRDHLHLIAEAQDRRALSRGLQGLAIRVARAVNRHLGCSGRLFADRYHARALKSPRTVRLALRYVLLNIRKHARAAQWSAGAATVPAGFVDARSSAPWFGGFRRPEGLAFGADLARAEWARASGSSEPPVAPPGTWLLRAGWKRAGAFDVDDAPA